MCTSLKNWDKVRFTEPFPSFAPNTHKLYILIHCINIVFILQKNHIIPSTLKYFESNNNIIQLSLDFPF